MAASDTMSSVELPSMPAEAQPVLGSEDNAAAWPSTPGFRAFWGWCQRRCDRIQGKHIMSADVPSQYEVVTFLVSMLDEMIKWVDEAPALAQSNQRFGNLAFRTYYKLIEKRIPRLWQADSIPDNLASQVIPLLLNSTAFGQPTRLDYGTGHELAFMLALWCCVVSGWTRQGAKEDEEEQVEDELILRVFPRYLDLVTLLQQTYRLEPAGSHGVWGLDDYCFFPYLFGSAQLLGTDSTPSSTLALALSPLPTTQITDLYALSLRRITLFKTGAAFSEHSPLLYNLSTFPNWQKPHSGLRKMFLGEVAGKRVVVQGLWIGGWCWGPEMPHGGEAGERRKKVRDESIRTAGKGEMGAAYPRAGSASHAGMNETTPAPWARPTSVSDSRAAILDATRATWASPPPRR